MRFAPLVLAALLAAPAAAQDRIPSHCIAVAQNQPPERLWQAAWTDPVPDYSLRIHYITHSMFLLQTPGGLSAATDYTGYLGSADLVPDVVTMNHAHSSHWTTSPDPRIPNVLKGWGDSYGVAADHHLDLGEMLVRNVSTDIRGGFSGAEENGNSIFVFEAAGLCVAHLGHLHQEPNDQQYAALGRIDVLMVPVDGGLTLDLPSMMRVVDRLQSSVVIPMHWFSGNALETFLMGMQDHFLVERTGTSELILSLRTLPERPTIMVLTPEMLE